MTETGAWMPMYWSDYLGDTMHLTTEQHGAYMLLIGAYWLRGGPLPADDNYLKNLTRAGRRWGHIKPVVMAFFELEECSLESLLIHENVHQKIDLRVNQKNTKTGFRYRHKRLDKEILRSSGRLKSARAAGKAGGLAKSYLTTTTTIKKKQQAADEGLDTARDPPDLESSCPEFLKRKTDPATELVQQFDRLVEIVFGSDQRRPWPHHSDRGTCRQWLDRGLTEVDLEFIAKPIFERRSAQGQGPPGACKYLSEPIREYLDARDKGAAVTPDNGWRPGPGLANLPPEALAKRRELKGLD